MFGEVKVKNFMKNHLGWVNPALTCFSQLNGELKGSCNEKNRFS